MHTLPKPNQPYALCADLLHKVTASLQISLKCKKIWIDRIWEKANWILQYDLPYTQLLIINIASKLKTSLTRSTKTN